MQSTDEKLSNLEVDAAIKAFNRRDVNATGFIEHGQIFHILTELGIQIDSELVKEQIKKVDPKNNGTVKLKDFLEIIFALKVAVKQQQEKRKLEDLEITKRASVSPLPVMTRSTHASVSEEMHSYKRFDELLNLNNNDDSADEGETLLRKPRYYWSPSPAYRNLVRSLKILIIVVVVLGLVALGVYFAVHFDSHDTGSHDKPPTVKISNATAITDHTAILNGHIVADGSKDKFRYYFMYATSTSFNQTAPISVQSNYNGGVSCMVGYLQADEAYSFSLVLEMEPDSEDDDWTQYTSTWAYFQTLPESNSTTLYMYL